MKNLKELEKSTFLLKDIYNSDISVARKISILEQIYSNLKIFKAELSAEDYAGKFSKLEKSVNEKVQNLTDQSFIDKLVSQIEGLRKSFGV